MLIPECRAIPCKSRGVKDSHEPGRKTMIQLRIKNESDLYNPYDPSRTRINDGVYSYMKSFCKDPEFQQSPHNTLQIITDCPIDQERFFEILQRAVRKDQDEFDRQISRNNRRVIWELIIGIVLSVIGVFLSVYLDQVLLAIISFFGTMAIRDAIVILVTINQDIRRLKKLLDPFSRITVEVVRNIE